uniref:Uncharacterized protein n=1 Tax=uncultured planctomycete 8FN TaxID=455070 RepID=A9LH29_9BACT|nr:hypothetical protein 8FN_28 [uncultured planctomycete 8FN]
MVLSPFQGLSRRWFHWTGLDWTGLDWVQRAESRERRSFSLHRLVLCEKNIRTVISQGQYVIGSPSNGKCQAFTRFQKDPFYPDAENGIDFTIYRHPGPA